VWVRVTHVATGSLSIRGKIIPGHDTKPGSRTPPSHTEPLPSRKGPADPPSRWWFVQGPLSLLKKTMVLLR
jgi:hypothetical protein